VLITLRRRGQSIRIDDDIEIIVLEIQRSRVRIGIKAPQSKRINCSEIVLIQEQNAIASNPPAPGLPSVTARRPASYQPAA
jgi:carbon storage regulator CsrA